VLDHLLWSIDVLRVGRFGWAGKQCEQLRTIVEDVDITRARDLDARNFFDVFELRLEFLGNSARVLFLARGLFDQFRQLERDRESEIAELRTRRDLGSLLSRVL